jgi:superfamily II DNA/RNA helicase
VSYTRVGSSGTGRNRPEVARPLGLFTEVFHGGVSYDPQSRALYNGLDVLVGTPGRVIDHLNRGNLDLSECNIVVLDEAGTCFLMKLCQKSSYANCHCSQKLFF